MHNIAVRSPITPLARLPRLGLWAGQVLLGSALDALCRLPILQVAIYWHTEPPVVSEAGVLGPAIYDHVASSSELWQQRVLFIVMGCKRDGGGGRPGMQRDAFQAHFAKRIHEVDPLIASAEVERAAAIITSICFGLFNPPEGVIGMHEFAAFLGLVATCCAAEEERAKTRVETASASGMDGTSDLARGDQGDGAVDLKQQTDAELLWQTLDVARKGTVSHDELVRWSSVMLSSAGVRVEHRGVRLARLSSVYRQVSAYMLLPWRGHSVGMAWDGMQRYASNRAVARTPPVWDVF